MTMQYKIDKMDATKALPIFIWLEQICQRAINGDATALDLTVAKDFGICHNVQVKLGHWHDAYDIVTEVSSTWKHNPCFGARNAYPIPRATDYELFRDGLGKWVGQQLVYRHDLLRHIISELEKL